MAATSPGATLLIRVQKEAFTKELARRALDTLFQIKYPLPSQLESWHKKSVWAEERVSRIHQGQFFAPVAFWNPPKRDGSLIGMTTVAQYHLDARNPLKLPGNDVVWLTVWLFEGNFQVTELDKAKRVAENFKALVEALKPTFAAVDNYGENMVKRKGKDPRRFAWGAMYYDANHVKRIGIDKLRACAALIKQEYPDDSMWIQTWGNPFIVAKELTQQMEKELELKRVFDGEAASAATARSRMQSGKRKTTRGY